jgi:hypothetical protein
MRKTAVRNRVRRLVLILFQAVRQSQTFQSVLGIRQRRRNTGTALKPIHGILVL